jgi:hypothetical protein
MHLLLQGVENGRFCIYAAVRLAAILVQPGSPPGGTERQTLHPGVPSAGSLYTRSAAPAIHIAGGVITHMPDADYSTATAAAAAMLLK